MATSTAKPSDPVRLFAALADRTRLRLLNLMNGHEVCVCDFVAILKQSQPKISRHLAYLRRAGIVAARRDGRWMHYRIVLPPEAGVAEILRTTLAALARDSAMQSDLDRFGKAGCTETCAPALSCAPRPAATRAER